ncbi:MAG: hypothetical protein HZA53_12765 [Planctomycetes bacterium]|nr:hypothetical protein [Planctomycetota bacterium]
MSTRRGRAGGDVVRDFLRARGCAEHVIEGGLEGLVAAWERTALEVERGYRGDRDEYRNDLDARQVLADSIAAAPSAASPAIIERIEAADERLRGAVELGASCVWGTSIAKRERWTTKRNWWYFTQLRER